jgi:hypothetical protein
VRQYADAGSVIRQAIASYRQDVENGGYPGDAESYHLPQETAAELDKIAEHKRRMELKR